jgi:hypothetical protein
MYSISLYNIWLHGHGVAILGAYTDGVFPLGVNTHRLRFALLELLYKYMYRSGVLCTDVGVALDARVRGTIV